MGKHIPKRGQAALEKHPLCEARFIAIEQLIAERDRLYLERHTANLHATTVAATALSSRLDGMNEFRAQILQERSSFVTRELLDARTLSTARDLDTRFAAGTREREGIDARLREVESQMQNYAGRFWMVGVAATVVGGLIGAAMSGVVHSLTVAMMRTG